MEVSSSTEGEARETKGLGKARPEGGEPEPEERLAGEGAPQDSESVTDDGEQDRSDHHREDARDHQVAVGVDGESAERVHLFGDGHGGELCRVVAPDPPTEHER